MFAIIDVAQDTTAHLTAIKAAGITSIIRYDCRLVHGRWKEASNNEWKAIIDHGFRAGVVNEGVGNTASAFTFQTGYDDACYSLERAVHRNQPAYSAIFYALDWDISYSDLHSHAIPYFNGVKKAHSENRTIWRIGAYCSGLAAATLEQEHLIYPGHAWITCSGGFQGSRAYVTAGRECLWQYACDREFHNMSVDHNLSPTGNWGWWSKDGIYRENPAPPVPPTPTPAYVDTGKASWYNDNTNADGSPVHNSTDMTCAHRTLPFGTKLRVTRLDNGKQVEVTVHDRGPYVTGRLLDLRPAAARALEMIDAGIVPVKIESIQ